MYQLFFFFKQKTAYEMQRGLVGSEMCIRDSINAEYMGIERASRGFNDELRRGLRTSQRPVRLVHPEGEFCSPKAIPSMTSNAGVLGKVLDNVLAEGLQPFRAFSAPHQKRCHLENTARKSKMLLEHVMLGRVKSQLDAVQRVQLQDDPIFSDPDQDNVLYLSLIHI
eukprot:TRINITY_DN65182_c0_g1_i1.p1 TRINITY_DN65182_c0_g1~~TRINITY_DN65182_c0_g1_i1.p1  ORF type:complete len:167 (-),score=34.51 TRINITY_DN65182_c0_g1_i1:124-624(-)